MNTSKQNYELMQIFGLLLMVLGIGDVVTFQFGTFAVTIPTGAFIFIWGTLKRKKLRDFI